MKKTKSKRLFTSVLTIPKLYKKLVLLQYENCGPCVQLVTSNTPLTIDRISAYFQHVDGADWEHDSLTILGDSEIAELSIDRKPRR